jgi:uridylate kinase
VADVFVIKLGGSNVSISKDLLFDFAYMENFRMALEPALAAGSKFFVTLGGGFAARMYRDLVKEAGITDTTHQHWVGTTVNVLNAYLAAAFLKDIADPEVYKYEDYYDDSELKIGRQVKLGGGGRPGHSGDVDAILAAKKLGAKTIFSLKNIDGVYSADPKLEPSAVRKEKLNWDEYFGIIGWKKEHEPGGNYPIDPVAAGMAKEAGMSFIVLLGSDLKNFTSALNGAGFTGTIVSD